MMTLEEKREYQRNWIAKRRLNFFKDKCCAKCGSIIDLELDHIDPLTKLTHNIFSWSKKHMEEELSKCQVLCKKCHKEKTKLQAWRPITHGTLGGYSRGCRCVGCTEKHKKTCIDWKIKTNYRNKWPDGSIGTAAVL